MNETRNRFYLIMIATSLLMIAVLISVLLRDRARGVALKDSLTQVAAVADQQHDMLTAVASYTPPLPPTATAPSTPTPNHLQTVQAEATALRVQIFDLLDVARNEWTPLFSGDFDDGTYEWATDAGEDQYASAQRSVINGDYVWDVQAKTDFFWMEAPEAESLDDFYISAELSHTMSGIGEYGVLFRVVDNSNFYFFSLCDDLQAYYAGRRVEGDWFTLLSCTPSDAITTSGPNLLEVVGQGSQFLLSINGQFVNEMLDTSHSRGRFGVIIKMDADDANTYTFHQLAIRSRSAPVNK